MGCFGKGRWMCVVSAPSKNNNLAPEKRKSHLHCIASSIQMALGVVCSEIKTNEMAFFVESVAYVLALFQTVVLVGAFVGWCFVFACVQIVHVIELTLHVRNVKSNQQIGLCAFVAVPQQHAIAQMSVLRGHVVVTSGIDIDQYIAVELNGQQRRIRIGVHKFSRGLQLGVVIEPEMTIVS